MATRIVFGPAPAPAPPPAKGSAVAYVTRYVNRSLDDGVTVAESVEEVAAAFDGSQFGTLTVEHHDGTSDEIRINRDHVRMVRPGDATSWAPEDVPAETVEG